jgi:carbon monoxide dehydrogenase subunit G
MRYEVTTTIDAPAEVVWRAVRDVEKWSDWTPTVTEIRVHGGDEIRQGSVATVRQPKQPAREWTVTELVDGRSFRWTSSGPGLRFAADHALTTVTTETTETTEKGDGDADADRTTVELTFAVAGPLAPLATLLAGKAIRAAVDTEAASLKKWCEQASRS